MKVVLFCGGMGTRLKEFSETTPKPMVDVGGTPILIHLMKYYAHYGHKEFILCLGYGANHIKQYFLNYDECLANDFTYAQGGRHVEVSGNTISDWTIKFVDTGLNASIGQRLRAVRKHVDSDEVFMANYADGLSDLDLDEYLEFFHRQNKTACFASVRPQQTFHYVVAGEDGLVQSLQPIGLGALQVNGGFFVFRPNIFDYIQEGEDLVEEPFQRLIAAKELVTYRYAGFWVCMDTLRDKRLLDSMHEKGQAPWAVWRGEKNEPAANRPVRTARGAAAPILLDRSHLVARHRTSKRAAAGER
ncbi:MAG: glucose-1-phosphate cytidylyltransferase [Bryobacterales bacterium]|nr:glucose-1-phosphate cytidylyltransferase [Bryobacterales bacterium]